MSDISGETVYNALAKYPKTTPEEIKAVVEKIADDINYTVGLEKEINSLRIRFEAAEKVMKITEKLVDIIRIGSTKTIELRLEAVTALAEYKKLEKSE